MKVFFYALAIALVLSACISKVVKSNSGNAERTTIFLEKFAFSTVGNYKILFLQFL